MYNSQSIVKIRVLYAMTTYFFKFSNINDQQTNYVYCIIGLYLQK